MKKMLVALVAAGLLITTLVEAGRFGDTFGGTFLGTTGGVVLGNAISGNHRHRSDRRGREYCERCRYLEDRARDLEKENDRLRDKLDRQDDVRGRR